MKAALAEKCFQALIVKVSQLILPPVWVNPFSFVHRTKTGVPRELWGMFTPHLPLITPATHFQC